MRPSLVLAVMAAICAVGAAADCPIEGSPEAKRARRYCKGSEFNEKCPDVCTGLTAKVACSDYADEDSKSRICKVPFIQGCCPDLCKQPPKPEGKDDQVDANDNDEEENKTKGKLGKRIKKLGGRANGGKGSKRVDRKTAAKERVKDKVKEAVKEKRGEQGGNGSKRNKKDGNKKREKDGSKTEEKSAKRGKGKRGNNGGRKGARG